MNSISIVGSLCNIDPNDSTIRYIKHTREYKNKLGKFVDDYIPCVWWTRTNKNELFSLSDNSFVAIQGRIEVIENKVVIIIESMEYLGIKT